MLVIRSAEAKSASGIVSRSDRDHDSDRTSKWLTDSESGAGTPAGFASLEPRLPFEYAPQLAQVPVDLLYADRDGNLWAGGDIGLARIRSGRMVSFVAPKTSPRNSSADAW